MKNILCYPIFNDKICACDSVEQKVIKCGSNTGNLVWAEMVSRTIGYDEKKRIDEIYEIEAANYILPMANQINVKDSNIEKYAGILTGKKNKITVVGLGAQLTEELDTPRKLVAALPEIRKNALKELSLHCEMMGLRGYITAECLDLLGIHNHKVIGCPSFYSSGINGPEIGKASSEKICFNWGAQDEKQEQYLKNMLRLKGKEGYALIMQAMSDFPKVLFEDAGLLERHVKRAFPDVDISADELFAYIKRVGHMFFDVDTWLDFLKKEKFTMATGCRFHGNMVAFLAGIPSLWVVHDSRTRELTEVLKLPSIDIGQTRKVTEVEQLCEYCEYDKAFYDNYRVMFQAYLNFLKINSLEYVK